jgi:hypothetical protein
MPTISPPRTDTQDGPRRGRRWPLLAGLVLVAVALAGAAAALHSVGGRDETTSFTATGVRELVVHHRAGRISLVPSPDGSVRVTTTRRWSLWAPRTGHAQAGGVLTLSGSCPPLGSLGITRCAVDEQVTVPAGLRVRVTTSTGDLVGTDLAVSSLDARVSRGSITASFTRPPDRVLALLDAGSVRLTVPATTYAVDATVPAQAGDLNVQVPTDPAAPRQISAHLSRGDIQILRR